MSFSLDPTREITLPGDGLLPASAEPLPPPDIRVGEIVRVLPPAPPWKPSTREDVIALSRKEELPQLDRRYWRIRDAYQADLSAIGRWTNDPGPGLPPFGMGGGLDRVPDPVTFDLRARLPEPRADLWEGHGVLVVSTRLLRLLEEIDGAAIVHKPVELRGRGGEIAGEYHFVDVVRKEWAVDFANSVVDYHGGSIYEGSREPPYPIVYKSVRFRDDLDPSSHIFRQATARAGRGTGCFVSNALKERIEAMTPEVRNVAFDPLHEGF